MSIGNIDMDIDYSFLGLEKFPVKKKQAWDLGCLKTL